jgi:phage shock protein A
MPSIFEKVNTLISANLHAIVDKALEDNNLKVMDEYIRQAESHIDSLEDSAATVGGNVKTLKRKYDEFSAQVEKLDRDIDMLLVKNKADLATAAQADMNNKKQLAQEYYEQWQQQQGEYQKLMDAKLKLEARLTSIRQEREQLKHLMELAEAKKITTKSIRSLDDISNIGDAEISSIGDKIRAQLDKVDAEAEMVSSRLTNQIDDVIGASEIELQLEERRARLGLNSEE